MAAEPFPGAGGDRPPKASSRRRRLRARTRLWRMRMRSHPVLLWTWRTAVVLVGGALLLLGAAMWFTPGPGWAAVVLGLAVLASEFGWARALLLRMRHYALRAHQRALAMWERRRQAHEEG